jgi:hypothetical protein
MLDILKRVFTTNYFAKCEKPVAFAIVLLLDL